jgi:hypothetical protein
VQKVDHNEGLRNPELAQSSSACFLWLQHGIAAGSEITLLASLNAAGGSVPDRGGAYACGGGASHVCKVCGIRP